MSSTPLSTLIKICGLTREADVLACINAGANAIGFVMYPKSARFVSPERAGTLAKMLPSKTMPVLLFVNASLEEVQAACRAVPNALLQFHGDETPFECDRLAQAVQRPYWRAARIPTENTASFDLVKFCQDYSNAQAILLDAHVDGYGGGGKTFNWSQLPPNVNAHLVLSGGLTPANVTDGIRQLRPKALSLAVDVSSGVELDGQKGLKDARKIQEFVAAVKAADAIE
ncbi:phosphoribosylanthranilate isomerase [Limnohabitans sp. MMS-10A-178]|jgi:phosphoribosylanthranilate isomerase|uniref:phosphoribosylanthranilate isomerase n=1 Tax=Limnohabitans sp. MMS-10A-178 TaxID=1835767 RepID=UPI000D36112C|nr:phosphoribosylanthranilate isomerase [Limnohabitans sp. MMS-10A-178]PUE17373.1 N-(5'-phosphoribosyl)anthranilate isomerase [Limnohabitans sp. MMS-10A-178]